MSKSGWYNESRRHALASKGIETGRKVDMLMVNPKKKVLPFQSSGLGKANNVTIIARRWFDRVYGNTYHSTEVYVDGKLIGKEPFTYGYGEQYLNTAHGILTNAGYYSYEKTKEDIPIYDKVGKYQYSTPKESMNKQDSYHNFMKDMREQSNKFVVSVSDVGRRGDL